MATQDGGIAAVVVTYQPDPEALAALLTALRPQLQHIWLVDNASPSALLDSITRLAAQTGAEMLKNPRNFGVAAALNQGIAAARSAGCSHVLLMDQDSLPDAGMVAALANALHHGGADVAAVGPCHVDARTGQPAPFIRIGFPLNRKLHATDNAPVDCDFLITSGALVPMRVLETVGAMDEGLFIDNVDLEWCFRAKSHGLRLLGVPAARMQHCIGERLQWRPGGQAIVHKPGRLYYIMRNRLLLYRMRHVPRRWVAQDLPRALLKFGGFALAVAPRAANLRAMLRGLRDGLAGRTGPDPG